MNRSAIRIFLFALILLPSLSTTAQQPLNIDFSFQPFSNRQLHIRHYYGSQVRMQEVDSIMLDEEGRGSWRGDKKPGDGIYMAAIKGSRHFVVFIIEGNSRFRVEADSFSIHPIFISSPENSFYAAYQSVVKKIRQDAQSVFAQKLMKVGDSLELSDKMQVLNDSLQQFRKNTILNHPQSFIAKVLRASLDPELPPNAPSPEVDSIFAWRYTKQHFFDHLAFYEDFMVRTPFLEDKLDRFFDELVFQVADSVNKEMDWMLSYASVNETMQQFMLRYFIDRYSNDKEAWTDAVYLHLFENHLNGKTFSWLSSAYSQALAERATNIMATFKGETIPDISGNNHEGKNVSLHSIKAEHILLVVWDVSCPHCREQLPILHRKYLSEWKGKGIEIFAFSKESDNSEEIWKNFIRQNDLGEWNHVYYSKASAKARKDSGLTDYSKMLDVTALPTFYLLDNNKQIMGRKVSLAQVSQVLQLKAKP
jgi:peroxiredoxin